MSPRGQACTRPTDRRERIFAATDTKLLIDCAELAARLGETALRIVDCRFALLEPEAGRQEYLQEHIPGAVYADLDRDLAGPVGRKTGRHPLPDPEVMAATLGRLGIGNETEVIVYDHGSGGIAARLWWLLRWLGHDKARLLDGGFGRWQSLDMAMEEGDHRAAPVLFEPAARPELLLQADEILDALADGEPLQLVDAREAERFAGIREPIDPVAGHIPGAVNLPFLSNLREDGSWKTPDELAALWSQRLEDKPEVAWSVMCGSGVTACHLVISALLAGLPEPRLYVGSWSEWISEPSRPIAQGL